MKKITGDKANDHYMRYCPLRDNWHQVHPEFHHMSKRPGIGKGWIEKNVNDVYPHDEVPIPGRGVVNGPPNYYDTYAEKIGFDIEKIKQQRRHHMEQSMLEGPSLESRAMVQDAQIARMRRNL